MRVYDVCASCVEYHQDNFAPDMQIVEDRQTGRGVIVITVICGCHLLSVRLVQKNSALPQHLVTEGCA